MRLVQRRRIAVLGPALLLLVMLAACGGPSPTPPAPAREAAAEPAQPPAPPPPEYQFVTKEDLSFGGVKRYQVGLAVQPGADQAMVQAAIEHAVQQLSTAERVNAISVLVYDRPQDAGDVYTLAQADWAPGGDWAKADSVRAGDYSGHQFSFSFRGKVTDPGTVTRPTDAEFAIHDAYRALRDADPNAEEDALIGRVASERGMTDKEVKSALMAWVVWAQS